ncbi:3-hydroxyacyl-CoA dehydrogenase NAD-binding domain-containing protein [Teichococcus oryzae]|uniref:3-hydroxyacyl-CoA dehydrogenase n=1 Tax=Teichococcus oryzae TaxID=1608942 RepID=A0A5B2TEG4_9PROT|nr:3-hydroxyacyl-CoA dehydrogenase NAD-binding domain-containing protein [Pseudoroseomonas oryzae]KAA2212549.1 3-hydroxyacyl-CoA dehydrogenase [Pseudoroseomonas oryzae]
MEERALLSVTVEDRVAVLRIANPPVNALSAALRAALRDAVAQAVADQGIQAIVLAASGRTFVAGADISEFGKPPISPSLPDVLVAMDECPKPLVAAISGAALGGGLELALGCDARVASSGVKLGLPEVKLGILPGAGGTQRLPRLIGAAAALEMAASGEPVTAETALSLGIVDEVVAGDPLPAALRRARALAEGGQRPQRLRDGRERLGPRDAFEAAAAKVLRRAPDNPAVASIVESVRSAYDLPFDEAMSQTRAMFLRLVQDDRSKALRHVFFAERAAQQPAGLSREVRGRAVSHVAVIGAGTMGGGIAMSFANAGIPVTLIEAEPEALERGLQRIAQNYATSVQRGSLAAEERDRRLARIGGGVGLENAAGADLVVEAVFEDLALKQKLFAQLDGIARPGAVLATNTSYLDVDAIAGATRRPDDVLGMHFFSPANVMKLLEVVRGAGTSPETLATAVELGRRLGKVPVVVGVCHGFVGNRMLARRTAQAERLLLEGALPEQVDAALVAFGFRMGPFAMADLAGLDIGWRIRKATGKTAPVADALCEAGRLGQKTGKGYYDYGGGGRQGVPDPAVRDLIEATSARLGIARRAIGQEEVTERLILPMIDEGARILEEGIAARPGDVDVVWLHGYNWPAWRGGPMYHGSRLGPAYVAQRLEAYAGQSGDPSLHPSAALRRLAREGRDFDALSGTAR